MAFGIGLLIGTLLGAGICLVAYKMYRDKEHKP